jgi:hypothetical protein
MAAWIRAIGAAGAGFVGVAAIAELGHLASVRPAWLLGACLTAAGGFVVLLLVYLVGASERFVKMAERQNKTVVLAGAICLLVAAGLFFSWRGLVPIPDRPAVPSVSGPLPSSSPLALATPPTGAVASSPGLQAIDSQPATTPTPHGASNAHPQSTASASTPASSASVSTPPSGMDCQAATQSGLRCANDKTIPAGETMSLTTWATALVGAVVNGVWQGCTGDFEYDHLQRLVSCGTAKFAVVAAGPTPSTDVCGPSVPYSLGPIALSGLPLGNLICVENQGRHALLELVASPTDLAVVVDVEVW